MKNLSSLLIQTFDTQDLPTDLCEDIVERSTIAIFHALLLHAYMTLPIKDQQELMAKLNSNTHPTEIYHYLESRMPQFKEEVAKAFGTFIGYTTTI